MKTEQEIREKLSEIEKALKDPVLQEWKNTHIDLLKQRSLLKWVLDEIEE